jgi:hypothetical protein
LSCPDDFLGDTAESRTAAPPITTTLVSSRDKLVKNSHI